MHFGYLWLPVGHLVVLCHMNSIFLVVSDKIFDTVPNPIGIHIVFVTDTIRVHIRMRHYPLRYRIREKNLKTNMVYEISDRIRSDYTLTH